jgi:phosphohistidine phosphatase
MYQLLFLRHAKAEPARSGEEDEGRALAPQGRRDAEAMGRAMRRLGLVPDLVLVSPARRTRETLELVDWWDEERPLVETVEELYLAEAPVIAELLRGIAETIRSVLVIGHNPGLHECALWLGEARGEAYERLKKGLPTASLLEFELSRPWSEIGPHRLRLQRFLTPKTLDERS